MFQQQSQSTKDVHHNYCHHHHHHHHHHHYHCRRGSSLLTHQQYRMSLMMSIINSVRMFTFSKRIPRLQMYTRIGAHKCTHIYTHTHTLSLVYEQDRPNHFSTFNPPSMYKFIALFFYTVTQLIWVNPYVFSQLFSFSLVSLSKKVMNSSSSVSHSLHPF